MYEDPLYYIKMKIFSRNFTDLWSSKKYVDMDVSRIPNEYKKKFKCDWNYNFTTKIKLI